MRTELLLERRTEVPPSISAERDTESTSSTRPSAPMSIDTEPLKPGATSGLTPPTTELPPP